MRLTMGTVYAVHALAYLGRGGGPALVTARSLAEAGRVPERFLQKVLGYLVRAGVVTSFPGPTGGFRLTRPPERVSFLEILEAVEGPLRGNVPPVAGKATPACTPRLQTLYDEVAEVARRRLRKVTLAELIGR